MSTAPKRMPRAQRRTQLIDSAVRVFAERGYSAASMDDVAEAAGISKPVLYQHFDSKLDLYLAVARTATQTVDSLLRTALDSEGDGRVRIRRTIRAFFRFADEHRDQYTIAYTAYSYEPAAQRIFEEVRSGLARELARVVSGGADMDEQTTRLVGGTIATIGESATRFVIADDAIDRDAAADAFTAFIWNGIEGLDLFAAGRPSVCAPPRD
ncbi:MULTISPECIES: TetR/AcrR family transcriptional regulator [Brevibacterium]|uniref:TetR/AcrR family transcriptional regulator n=1 Tax=Brevibacterium salitolerans TaxID=1403566 RepID=A0ABN2WB94_9MICO|nr:TetR/AcrR family transcriptional regulator [Brevibacterium sp.]